MFTVYCRGKWMRKDCCPIKWWHGIVTKWDMALSCLSPSDHMALSCHYMMTQHCPVTKWWHSTVLSVTKWWHSTVLSPYAWNVFFVLESFHIIYNKYSMYISVSHDSLVSFNARRRLRDDLHWVKQRRQTPLLHSHSSGCFTLYELVSEWVSSIEEWHLASVPKSACRN